MKPQEEILLILRRNRPDNVSGNRFCHYLIGYFWWQLNEEHVQALRDITQDFEEVDEDAV